MYKITQLFAVFALAAIISTPVSAQWKVVQHTSLMDGVSVMGKNKGSVLEGGSVSSTPYMMVMCGPSLNLAVLHWGRLFIGVGQRVTVRFKFGDGSVNTSVWPFLKGTNNTAFMFVTDAFVQYMIQEDFIMLEVRDPWDGERIVIRVGLDNFSSIAGEVGCL